MSNDFADLLSRWVSRPSTSTRPSANDEESTMGAPPYKKPCMLNTISLGANEEDDIKIDKALELTDEQAKLVAEALLQDDSTFQGKIRRWLDDKYFLTTDEEVHLLMTTSIIRDADGDTEQVDSKKDYLLVIPADLDQSIMDESRYTRLKVPVSELQPLPDDRPVHLPTNAIDDDKVTVDDYALVKASDDRVAVVRIINIKPGKEVEGHIYDAGEKGTVFLPLWSVDGVFKRAKSQPPRSTPALLTTPYDKILFKVELNLTGRMKPASRDRMHAVHVQYAAQ
ncbi:hypothetical protein FOZ60_014777 [Perkinsus olseni]|uniref:Uncharacterized protein n=1 Tax=Perkinsus olseni TaxID=32597 RepID=A0A7J6N7A3_PEROL|nr:hypothetical protein FOZ60_014777 [Perkinsus olseni]